MKKLAFVCGAVLVTMAPIFYEVQAEELYSIDYSEVEVAKEEGTIFKDAQGVVYKIIMNQEGQREVQIGDGEKPIPGLGVDIVIPEEVEHEGNQYKVTKVASFAFTTYEDEAGNIAEGGSNVEDIQLPKTIRSIDDKAFYSSIYLRNVRIEPGSELSYIGDHAFAFSSLTGFSLPDRVETIGKSAFTFNNQLVYFDISDTSQLKTIGEGAFRTNPKLKKLYLPKEVTDIGDYPFSGAIGLRELQVSEENGTYSSLNGVLFNKDQSTLIAYPADKDGGSYVFPDTVKVIGKNAFEYNVNLRDIVLNDGVVEIGDLVFKNMLRAEKITLGSQIESIGRLAFYNIENLEELVVPDSVHSYGKNPFYELNGLKKISLGAKTTDIKYGFLGGSFGNIQEIEFKNKEVVIGESAFMFFSNTNTEKITYLVASEAAKVQLINELGVSEEMIHLVDEPVVDEPVVDEPVVDEPVIDEPVVDEPVVDEPVIDEPVVDEPVVDEPVVDEPVVDEPVVDEPVIDEPVVEPVVDEPVIDEPEVDEPVVDEPVIDEPEVDEPAVDEPVVDEPAVDEPVVDEPVVDEPVVDEPVVDEPVVDEPVVDEPVVDEPVIDEPVVDEPVVDAPVVDELEVENTEDTQVTDKEETDKVTKNDAKDSQPSVSLVSKKGSKDGIVENTSAKLPQTNDKKRPLLSYLGGIVLSGTYLVFRRKR